LPSANPLESMRSPQSTFCLKRLRSSALGGLGSAVSRLLRLALFAWLALAGRGAWSATVADPDRASPAMVVQSLAEGQPSYQKFEGRLSELEIRLFADAADGHWDSHTLLTAALVASGVDNQAALRRYERRFGELVAELRRSGRVSGSPRQRAEAIFDFMHQRVLGGGYHLDCTDLAVLLEQGRFNCASASVLFSCLAGEFGLTVRGIEIPGHALIKLVLPEGCLDIETTCPDCFRLLENSRKQTGLPPGTLAGEKRARAPQTSREVSDVQLVAMIYYNRGVDLLAQNRFREALAANAKALRLDPQSATARGNLLATINNWAVAEARLRHYLKAVELLRRGLAMEPGYETLRVNLSRVYEQWADDLCGAERFAEALAVLAEAARDRPGEPGFVLARLKVYRRWARWCREKGHWEERSAVLSQARRDFGDAMPPSELDDSELAQAGKSGPSTSPNAGTSIPETSPIATQ